MRILVTGCSGFLGSELCKRLLAKNHTVYGLIRNDKFSANRIEGVDYIQGDLLYKDFLYQTVKHIEPEIIAHLAAVAPVRFSYDNPDMFFQVNTIGTVNVVEAAVKAGGVKQFCFAGTAEEYGPAASDYPLTEETVLHPSSPYSVSKMAADMYVQYAARRGIPYTVLRPTNTFDRQSILPDEARGYFVEKVAIHCLRNPHKRLAMDGSEDSTRKFMYVSDHVSAYVTVIGNPHAYNRVYNVAPDEPPMRLDRVVKMIAKMTGFKGDVTWMNRPRPLEPNFLNLDARLIRSELGWRARISLKDGLAKTVEHWRKALVRQEMART